MEITAAYTEFRSELLSYIKNKVRSKEDAEDILQNVFIKISSNIDKLEEDVKLKNWIFTITRNSIIDYYRLNARRKNIAIMDDVDLDIPAAENQDSTQGLDQCINRMIALLPDEYRDIIIDSEIKGIKQKDLADHYGLAYPSIRSRVQRGRERLKQLFYNCCHIETDSRGNVMNAQSRNACDSPCDPCSSE
jgi:RNA polymerase sigma-70 factor (ECF subfamily)